MTKPKAKKRCDTCTFSLYRSVSGLECRHGPPLISANSERTYSMFPPVEKDDWCWQHKRKLTINCRKSNRNTSENTN